MRLRRDRRGHYKLRNLETDLALRASGQDVLVSAVRVLREPYWVHGPGELSIVGAVPKEVLDLPSERPFGRAFIAKHPHKEGPLECVTEYLIGLIGKLLPLKVAEVDLVRIGDHAEDVRFLSRYFLTKGEEQLSHGSAVAATCFEIDEKQLYEEIPAGKAAEWSFYSTDLIDEMLRKASPNDYPALRGAFAKMLAFDALVGANDRHPQNWGLIRNVRRQAPTRFAPIYDTARGLFWNLTDSQLRERMAAAGREAFIRTYAQRSRSLIGVSGGTRQPSHFEVIQHLVESRKEGYLEPIREVVSAFSSKRVAWVLQKRLNRLVSGFRLDLIFDLLLYRRAVLMEVLR